MLDTLLGLRKQSGAAAAQAQYVSPNSIGFDFNNPSSLDQFFESKRETTSGIFIDHKSALCLPAFWQAVGMISDDVASIVYSIQKRDEDGDYLHDEEHPADYLVNEEANDNAPAFEVFARWLVSGLTSGNGYVHIERQMNGDPINLMPLDWWRTWPARDDNGELYYKTIVYGPGGGRKEEEIPAENMLHLKGMQLWDDLGCDPVDFHRDLIGLGQSAFSYAGQFFRRGGRAGGTLIIPPHIKGEPLRNIEEGFRKTYEQASAHFSTVIAREGVKFERQTMSPEEAELIEGRQADARDVARIFKVPPQKLGLADSVGFASLEQSQKQYFQQALMPWVKRVTGQFRLRLLTKGQRYKRSHSVGIDVSAIVQLDEKALNEILQMQRINAVISANEWRRKVGLEARDDDEADRFVNPNTTAPDSAKPEESASPEDNQPPADKQPPPQDRANGHVSDEALQRLLTATERRMLSRVCNDAQRRTHNTGTFADWLDCEFDRHHRGVIAESLGPVAEIVRSAHPSKGPLLADEWATGLVCEVSRRWTVYLEAPHAADQLAANIAAECKRLLDTNAEPILRL